MNLNLDGKVVLITGSGKGIGKEIARGFAQEGAAIIVNDVNPDVLALTVEELSAYPVNVFSVLGNMADENDAREMFSAIESQFGRLDVLINNAGILIDKPFMEIELLEWNRIFQNNLNSIFLASREAVNLMQQSDSPVIINAGSFGSVVPAIGYSAYNASKAAISNLTRTMAGELNPSGIRVAGYIPGVVLTDIIRSMLDKESDRLVAQIPLQRLADPGEIADVVVFLSSEKAKYINGTMLEISGGKLCVQNTGRYLNS